MIAGTTRSGRIARASPPRRFVSTLCLLVILLASFGYAESASASPVDDGYAVSVGGHATGVESDHIDPAAKQHCSLGWHCSLHAILPMASAEGAHGVTLFRSPPAHSANGRAVAPGQRPPSTADIG